MNKIITFIKEIPTQLLDFAILAIIFVGVGVLANFIPWLEWPYIGLNILIGVGILIGTIVGIYNWIKYG